VCLHVIRTEVAPAPAQSTWWRGTARLGFGIGFVPLFPR